MNSTKILLIKFLPSVIYLLNIKLIYLKVTLIKLFNEKKEEPLKMKKFLSIFIVSKLITKITSISKSFWLNVVIWRV